ncbi:2-dehydropantoate 2-reductase [Sulfitobacter donghicola]|uniref:2-dehydropantoate 2-reductase n=1 Tax=Sulfitobacter donghicola DSW-25 = KCTC 12864 = JCM 14565 TaxID=1300350 RepID=A0A073IJL9_9RHOB|nr:2-dehydropantoate 2-reductase [Sulfitobacter donghicola]KEJ89795.1 2-dehydropantoate 2-reductase [Sulfitobacter donghicola DSW-25 = KCTC 12864 = JCM 14565]KIN67099.1 2-dehydropantoate 2-reductase [Sulfitobacter donghicola DSW-25 = KCTC 12864 = JCM 14565]
MHIVVAGAGAIGCYVGGLLAHAGREVSFLGRPRILDVLGKNGLRVSDFSGLEAQLSAQSLDLHNTPEVLGRGDLILVCVKSAATAEIAKQIAAYAKPEAIIVSLQNGMGHADTLRKELPNHDVRAAMVPFNVVPSDKGHFHRATSGDIVIGAGPTPLGKIMNVKGLGVSESDEIEAVQWGKFLLNLNNAPNALSGMTLHAQLLSRPWRRLMADQMAEALRVLKAHNCPIRPTTPLPVGLVPHILRLPTPLFRRIAAKMLTIDPQARTSMAHDLMAGRKTEVDALQGRIIAMGQEKSVPTPLCQGMLAAIKQAEENGATPQTPDSLRG